MSLLRKVKDVELHKKKMRGIKNNTLFFRHVKIVEDNVQTHLPTNREKTSIVTSGLWILTDVVIFLSTTLLLKEKRYVPEGMSHDDKSVWYGPWEVKLFAKPFSSIQLVIKETR